MKFERVNVREDNRKV